MNERPKALWLEALRSDRYEQTYGRMRGNRAAPEGFCPLGLLCELYRKETGQGDWTENGTFILGAEMRLGYPPQRVAEWAGFEDWTGAYTEIGGANDRKVSFAEIADIIEDQL